ncbi:MAG: oxygenase MpaB family protein [Polyangiaceae bacterium]
MVVSRADLEATISRLESEVEDPRVGIYGPQSQSWKISKEAILFLGGGRAALLQTAHPYVAHGVDQHSATRTDPLGRFQRTFDNVFAMVFGDLESAIRSARRVHNIHTKITGLIQEHVGRFPAGSSYLANDEEALFWVHATLIETAVQVYELILRPLSYDEKDRYYQETRRFAYLFGIPDRVMPKDWDAFAAYNREMWDSDTLKVGKPALELRRFLFATPKPAYGPLFRWLETMTAGLMPERLRDEYELPWTPADQRWFRASVSGLKLSYPRLPARLRYLPAYVDARRRLAGKQGPDRVGQFLERLVMVPLRRAPAKRRPRRPASA